MNRRTLLRLSALVPFALLGACATTGGSGTIPTEAVTDASLIADGMLALLRIAGGVAAIASDQVAQLGVLVAQAKTAAAAIQPAIPVAVAGPSVESLAGAVSSIIALLSGCTLPAAVLQVLQAAQSLLPLVEAAVGILVMAAPSSGIMTPAQARAVLAAAA